jgi:4-diphosphocytidyl-2-C-methyl-D-erythritol kinase
MQINELARAKINLCLHVTGRRDDGYHLLDSIVAFADIGDRISVAPGDGFSLTINGPFANGLSCDDDNLVLQAARLYGNDCSGAAVTLTKNLPVASGIGGGSADAAATLRAMSRMTSVPLPLDRGLSLGADVPVCLQNTSCRMQGIGDVITPLSPFPQFSAVLVCPKVAVATTSVFAALECKQNAPLSYDPTQAINYGYISRQRNDLEKVAINTVPEIRECLDVIKKQGASLARMSGSGATCFGLFETEQVAQQAAKSIAASRAAWWVKPCVLGD